MTLHSKAELLAYLARTNPRLWEIIHPHVPLVSAGTRHLMVAMMVKSIAQALGDKRLSKALHELGKEMFGQGIKTMSYDDDDWCPTGSLKLKFPIPIPDPIPWRWIFSLDEAGLNPQPLPPQENHYYGAVLQLLSEAVTGKTHAGKLQDIAGALLKSKPAAGRDRMIPAEMGLNF